MDIFQQSSRTCAYAKKDFFLIQIQFKLLILSRMLVNIIISMFFRVSWSINQQQKTLDQGGKSVNDNNKNSRMTSLISIWCLNCQLKTHFTPCSSVSLVDFEKINYSCDIYQICSNKCRTSYKHCPVISSIPLGIHIEISATPLDIVITRTVVTFHLQLNQNAYRTSMQMVKQHKYC